MLTIHGMHEWEVVPGLQDTGGQNVFVNQLSGALRKKGYKITIANRGGYTHLRTGNPQSGLRYKDSFQRILYLEDGLAEFVRKEDMADRFPNLIAALSEFIQEERSTIDMIISHYWDAGMVGGLLRRELALDVPHIWVPHSLGMVKKRNLPSEAREGLRMSDRIAFEETVLHEVDFVASTSSNIQETSQNDYGYTGDFLWLPPCVDPERYHPRRVSKKDPVWTLLSQLTDLPPEEIRNRKIITEISRTDKTKQKGVLIKAFAQIYPKHPDSLLVVSIDRANTALADELIGLIKSTGVAQATAVVGSVWEQLPAIYAISDIYCTPSIVEGFGMSVQEAAATKVPVVSSDRVPFVTEYLADSPNQVLRSESGIRIQKGAGALIVPAGDIDGFAFAMDLLLSNAQMRKKMGNQAYKATIPYFTWDHIVQDFIDGIYHIDRPS